MNLQCRYPIVSTFCATLTAPYGTMQTYPSHSIDVASLFVYNVFIFVSEWGNSVHDMGRRHCGPKVQQYPQPKDHPCRQPGSAVLWERQSGVPVASVCQPQNHCALWVKIMLNIVHSSETDTHTHTYTQCPGRNRSNGLLRIWTWGRGI